MAQAMEKSKKQLTGRQLKKIRLVLLLLPFMVFVLIFNYAPLLGWSYAFVDFKPGVSVFDSDFVGLKYFQKIVANPRDFLNVMRNTLCISFLNICCSVLPAIFAIAISQLKNKKYAKMVQTGTSIPNFISWVVLGGIMVNLLSADTGIVNGVIKALGFEPIGFLADDRYFVGTMVVSMIWKTFGYNTIIYLAALTAVDPQLYEAATVDGAGRWSQLFHITLPCIMSTIVVMFIMRIGNLMQAGFEQIFVLYNPGVYGVADIIDTYVYRIGLQDGKFELATAVGLFKSVVNFVLIVIANKIARMAGEEGVY